MNTTSNTSALSELQKEHIFGGYKAYCDVWNAFNGLGLKECIYDDNSIVVFGMTSLGIATFKTDLDSFLMNIAASGVQPFAMTICKRMANTAKRPIDTYRLVNRLEQARVLWAAAVLRLQGEKDRLFDDCFENGNGLGVKKAAEYIISHEESPYEKWNMQTVEKALSLTRDDQLSLCL